MEKKLIDVLTDDELPKFRTSDLSYLLGMATGELSVKDLDGLAELLEIDIQVML